MAVTTKRTQRQSIVKIITSFETIYVNRNWTQKQAAGMLRISQSYFCEIMNRKKTPSEEVLKNMIFLAILHCKEIQLR